MLRTMRKNAGSFFIKILLGAIVVVFVFWGVGSFRSQRAGRVAMVNGHVITFEEYREAYNNLMEQLKQRFGNALTEDLIKTLQVKEQALGRLIDRALMSQEAERLKLQVSEQELIDAIGRIKAFQQAGQFDVRTYQKVLSQYRTTPEAFEETQRDTMLIERLHAFIAANVRVSEQEVAEWYNWVHSEVDIDFVLFDPESYGRVESSDEALKAYFNEHKEHYKTDPQIKVRYLRFDPDAYKGQVRIDEDEARNFYDANIEAYKKDKTVEARHILIQVDENAGSEISEKARQRAIDAMNLARKGENFAGLAQKYSDCPSKDNGGYLGTFKRQDMVAPFSEKAFSMKPGEISDPVLTQFGWHIIKVEKVNEATVVPLEKAMEDINQKLMIEKSRALAYDAAENAYDASFVGDDLSKIGEARNVAVETTDFFSRDKGPNLNMKNLERFRSEAFALDDNAISEILDLEDGYYLLQAIESKDSRIPELAEVKEMVENDLLAQLRDEKAKLDAETLLADIKSGKPLDARSRQYNLKPTQAGYFKRNDPIPNIGYEPAIAEAAFKLTEASRYPETVIKGAKGYYLIAYRERKKPDASPLDSLRDQIKEQLLQKKESKIFSDWLVQLKQKSDIRIEQDLL